MSRPWRSMRNTLYGSLRSPYSMPGRADRHARDGQADRLRLQGEQPADFRRRDMALEGIPLDRRRMACAERIGDAHPLAHRSRVVRRRDLDREAGVRQMLHPSRAAVAARILVDVDGRRCACRDSVAAAAAPRVRGSGCVVSWDLLSLVLQMAGTLRRRRSATRLTSSPAAEQIPGRRHHQHAQQRRRHHAADHRRGDPAA